MLRFIIEKVNFDDLLGFQRFIGSKNILAARCSENCYFLIVSFDIATRLSYKNLQDKPN